MPRKTVTYLNTLKDELKKDLRKLHELAEYLESETFDLSSLSCEEIRVEDAEYFDDVLKSCRSWHRDIGKQLKLVKERASNYRDFF